MPIDRSSGPQPVPVGPHERALADAWSRLPDHPDGVLARMAGEIVAMCETGLLELADLAQARVPDAIDYVERRRAGIGGYSMYLGRYARSRCELLPEALAASRPMRELLTAHADWQVLANDLASYARECAYDRDPNSSVLVLGRLLDCDETRALAVVGDLAAARVRQFERVAADELEPLLDEHELDEPTRASVLAYVGELEDWMAGARVWMRETGRYASATWTGTAAARVATLTTR